MALGPENRKIINQVLRPKTAKAEGDDDTPVEVRGVLRALHLEKDWLEVRVEGKIVHIDGLSEAADDIIGPMVNRSVIVLVKQSKKGRRRFIDIETED